MYEKVQQRTTDSLAGLQDTPYSECLRILGLPSLQFRQHYCTALSMMMLVFTSDFFTISSVTSTQRHMFKLFKPHATIGGRWY